MGSQRLKADLQATIQAFGQNPDGDHRSVRQLKPWAQSRIGLARLPHGIEAGLKEGFRLVV